MNKNDFLLVSDYRDENPRGWWMSEKLDGIRAMWDGHDFYSREGNVFPVPEWFKLGMPSTCLDGELYAGPGNFQKMLSLIRQEAPSAGGSWCGVAFCVFDAPNHGGDFEERQEFLKTLDLPPQVSFVPQIKCAERMHLDQFTHALELAHSEGWVLRKAHSAYEHGRTSAALKFKFKQEAEAKVIGYTQSENQSVIASIVCLFNEKTVRVGGLSYPVRFTPPVVGSRITISFYGLTDNGIPRHPSFVAERNYE